MIPQRSLKRNAGARRALMSVPLVTGCLLAPGAATAQEALRTAVEGDRSYQIRQQQASEPALPMSWGPVQFSVGASLRLTYDDNVLLSDANPDEDFIIAPGVDVGVFYPITERSRLSFGVGLAYEIYTQDTRTDRLSLSPNSEVALDFEVGRSLVTVYDRFSFSQDLLDQGEASEARNYGGFDNSLGFRVNWVPEPMFVETGYSWNLFLSSNDEFSELDRTSHQVFLRVGQVLAERTRWGVEGSGSDTTYDEGERNDFQSVSFGPFLEWQVTEAINLGLRGGWSWTMFDQTGTSPAPDDVSVPYLGIDARHQLTDNFNHSFSATREVRVGFNSEFIEILAFRYGFGWQLTEMISLSGGAFYELGEEPGDEEYDRYGLNLGVPFQLTDRLAFSLGYQFTVRDSNFAGRDYTNNRGTATLRYQF